MNKINLYIALEFAFLLSSMSYAGSVSTPNQFSSGTPAVAAEVNANFESVKTAVDDNNTRLDLPEQGKINDFYTLQTDIDTNSARISAVENQLQTPAITANPVLGYLGIEGNNDSLDIVGIDISYLTAVDPATG